MPMTRQEILISALIDVHRSFVDYTELTDFQLRLTSHVFFRISISAICQLALEISEASDANQRIDVYFFRKFLFRLELLGY